MWALRQVSIKRVSRFYKTKRKTGTKLALVILLRKPNEFTKPPFYLLSLVLVTMQSYGLKIFLESKDQYFGQSYLADS